MRTRISLDRLHVLFLAQFHIVWEAVKSLRWKMMQYLHYLDPSIGVSASFYFLQQYYRHAGALLKKTVNISEKMRHSVSRTVHVYDCS